MTIYELLPLHFRKKLKMLLKILEFLFSKVLKWMFSIYWNLKGWNYLEKLDEYRITMLFIEDLHLGLAKNFNNLTADVNGQFG